MRYMANHFLCSLVLCRVIQIVLVKWTTSLK